MQALLSVARNTLASRPELEIKETFASLNLTSASDTHAFLEPFGGSYVKATLEYTYDPTISMIKLILPCQNVLPCAFVYGFRLRPRAYTWAYMLLVALYM